MIRKLIIFLCLIGLLGSFPACMNVVIGYETITFPLAYFALIISTVLIIAKINIGYYLLFLTSFGWAIQLTNAFGYLISFRKNQIILLLLYVIPFIIFLSLLPIIVYYLSSEKKYKNYLITASIIVALFFPVYAIFERYNKNYETSVYAEFRLKENNQVEIILKPQPSDTRKILLVTNSIELENDIKKLGTPMLDFYYNSNTHLKLNYNFDELQNLEIIRLGKNKIEHKKVWTKEEINGDKSFLIY